jgi:hypothetical protein
VDELVAARLGKVQQVLQQLILSQNPNFEGRQGQFIIKHYAGDVGYAVEGMTDKNKALILSPAVGGRRLSSWLTWLGNSVWTNSLLLDWAS